MNEALLFRKRRMKVKNPMLLHTVVAGHLYGGGNSMMKLQSFGHINVVVDDLNAATQFYQECLGAIPIQDVPHFKNIGFAKAAGFLSNPQDVDVSIRFLALPLPTPVFMELMRYHSPRGADRVHSFKTNDTGGPRHICLRVENVLEAFSHVKGCPGVQMINPSSEYRPHKLDRITSRQFTFFDPLLEANQEAKDKACRSVGSLAFFYFIDPYGLQWEIEQAPNEAA
jgi:methylmalonyl-CoA/ethylmalonyl-CoA epimerase